MDLHQIDCFDKGALSPFDESSSSITLDQIKRIRFQSEKVLFDLSNMPMLDPRRKATVDYRCFR
jgi:hypothetical protein